ncbi:MAG TPA: PP2C family protein-serine/threonine phosphatase [Tepidisphaeraceae bacterium]|jgi:serine phosphatase RsbU (regulator of sigma subunit)|nr:PP2C family protein-serine/threonine phosphatase [Tepidisphaeraceae bacterium]
MDEAAKRYARRILLAHLLAFAVLIAFVVFAAREVYDRTRKELIDRTAARQTVLLNQTARGIESFYDGIATDLNLLRQAEATSLPEMSVQAPSPTPLADLMWQQLKGRASRVFVFDKTAGQATDIGATDDATPTAAIVAQTMAWLTGITTTAVSKYQQVDGQGMNLVCVPSADDARVFVAAVPVAHIDQQFMQEVNKQSTMGLTLVDDALATMATSNTAMVGMNLLNIPDETLQASVKQVISRGESATLLFERRIDFQGVRLQPAIVSAEPVKLPGKTWWVYIATSMDAVDTDLVSVFRRAIIWAGIAIVGLTAVLLSTAIVMIRERVRTERMQHAMLRRELDQAREIQLAWLPDRDTTEKPKSIDVAGLNIPASHISGDFYNWFELPDGRTVIAIGDVTGHGMAAAFLMATTQLLVRTTMPRVGEPGKCLQEVNRQLCVQVFNGQFVTMTLLVLDLEQGVIDIATAGHPPPLICEGGAYDELPITPELVMGIEADIAYPTERFALPPEAGLLLYTDGLPDAQAPSGDRLGADGLRKALFGHYGSSQGLLDATIRLVNEFRGPMALHDDLTLVAIQLSRARTRVARAVEA